MLLNKKKLMRQIIQSKGKNVLFADFVMIIKSFGFSLDRINGSHHIFVNKEYKLLISVQNDGKDAKPYQIKQFIAVIERSNLKMEE
jgi:predicted RNA binding protein YcfA (HicA-like mRNA interferase family)